MRPPVRAVLDRLLKRLPAGSRLSIDTIGEELGTLPVTQQEIEEVFDQLEAQGRSVWAPDEKGGLERLGQVLVAARALQSKQGRPPSTSELAQATGLTIDQVRRALLLGRVMGR